MLAISHWLRGYYVAGPPLLNERCTSLHRARVSKMTYTVSSWTLNFTIPYLSVLDIHI